MGLCEPKKLDERNLSFLAIFSGSFIKPSILFPLQIPTIALLPSPIPYPLLLPWIFLCYLPLSLLSSLSRDLFTPPPSPPTRPLLLSTHLGGATKFSRTTLPFRCLLIESLSPSNGSVRIVPEHQKADRLIEGEIQRDKGMARDERRTHDCFTGAL